MASPTSPEDGTRFIPDSMYNVFAYLCTGVLFFSVFALLFLNLSSLSTLWKSAEIAGQIALVLIAMSAVYIYSEFASVVSYHVVRRPVGFVVRFLKPRGMRDFFFDYQQLLRAYDLLDQFPGKQRNYWTLIYAVRINYPAIGNDLLERHARVKMARINSLNSVYIFLVALFALMKPSYFANATVHASGTNYLALVCSAGATLLFSFEFYQRQCWFGDIVVKISATLANIEKSAASTEEAR